MKARPFGADVPLPEAFPLGEDDWCNQNWGTKWNAENRRIVGESSSPLHPLHRSPIWEPAKDRTGFLDLMQDGEIKDSAEAVQAAIKEGMKEIYRTTRVRFGTAWCPPEGWLDAVSKAYPNFEFFLHYQGISGGLDVGIPGTSGPVYYTENGTPMYHDLCQMFQNPESCFCDKCSCSECGFNREQCDCHPG